MFGVIIVRRQRPRRLRLTPRRYTLREIATAVAMLQTAEAKALHAERDGCILHAIEAHAARHVAARHIPPRLIRDADWRHQHIEAPGVRLQARVEDRMREGDQ